MVCTELSQDIQNAILNNPKLKFYEAVINKKNITIPEIPEGKKPAQSIIKNVQHQHSHEVEGQEIRDIMRVNEGVNLQLIEANKTK